MERTQTCVLIIAIFFILVAGYASALDREQILVTPLTDWVTAGGTDTAEFEVTLDNDADGLVKIWCTDPSMGKITAGGEQSVDANGTVSATFTPGTLSGDAEIRVNVTIPSTGEKNETSIIQKIDHAIPKYYSGINYVPEVTVGNTTIISVSLSDLYGNMVDTRRQVDYNESIIFLASPEDDSGFLDGTTYVKRIVVPVNGTASVTYRVPIRAGNNVIQVSAPGSVINNVRWITIFGKPTASHQIRSAITSPIDLNGTEPHNATANGEDIFSLYYTVYDQYKNPVPGVKVYWELESMGSTVANLSYITNFQGRIYLEYGPSTVIQEYTATAQLSGNSSIRCSDTLSYIAGDPSLFTLSASPETMASREMDYSTISYIRAKLMDSLGRPLDGKTIEFFIESDTGSGSPLVTNASFAEDTTTWTTRAITNEDGYAIVNFYPGEFPKRLEASWSPSSIGVTIIRAKPVDLPMNRTLTLEYKNYPYLRAETEISPPLVATNDTVDITVRLIGDGFAQYNPIDVMLCNNRGEAMLQDMYWDRSRNRTDDKMVFLYDATRTFIYDLTPDHDYVGLVSFGINGTVNLPFDGNYSLPGVDNDPLDNYNYTRDHYMVPQSYDSYASLDSPLSTDLNAIAAKMSNTTPSRDPQGTVLVPMRYGLYKSINELKANAKPGHVRGIILLTDSEWTAYGDPTAGWDGNKIASNQGYYESERDPIKLSQGGLGMWTAFDSANWSKTDRRQDMAQYADQNDIHVYTIAYFKNSANIPVSLDRVLEYMADATGGRYYIANNARALEAIYIDIAEDLRKYASVDTSMNLSFEQIDLTYDNVTKSLPGSDVFTYVPQEGVSTHVTSMYKNGTVLPDLLPVPPYPADAIEPPKNYKGTYYIRYPYSLNQSAQWDTGTLQLYAGNITLGQIWEAKFRLKALLPGFIKVFGSNSAICYSNEENPNNCIPLPGTYLTVTGNWTNDPTSQNSLDIINGSITADLSENGDLTAISWVLNYTGNDTVLQDAYYQFGTESSIWNNNWIHFGSVRTEEGPINHITYSTVLNIQGIDGCVKIRIFAHEEVAPAGASDEEISEVFCPNRGPSIKIT